MYIRFIGFASGGMLINVPHYYEGEISTDILWNILKRYITTRLSASLSSIHVLFPSGKVYVLKDSLLNPGWQGE